MANKLNRAPSDLSAARRLSRLEALVVEMQGELATQSKRITHLVGRLDEGARQAKSAADAVVAAQRVGYPRPAETLCPAAGLLAAEIASAAGDDRRALGAPVRGRRRSDVGRVERRSAAAR